MKSSYKNNQHTTQYYDHREYGMLYRNPGAKLFRPIKTEKDGEQLCENTMYTGHFDDSMIRVKKRVYYPPVRMMTCSGIRIANGKKIRCMVESKPSEMVHGLCRSCYCGYEAETEREHFNINHYGGHRSAD